MQHQMHHYAECTARQEIQEWPKLKQEKHFAYAEVGNKAETHKQWAAAGPQQIDTSHGCLKGKRTAQRKLLHLQQLSLISSHLLPDRPAEIEQQDPY